MGTRLIDITRIEDPYTRLIQSSKFLDSVGKVIEQAARVRDLTILELREGGMTQQKIADALGVSHQRVATLEKRAKESSSD